MNARPITWPTVPKGRERIRVCLHAGNSREEVGALVQGMVEWADAWQRDNPEEREEKQVVAKL